MSQAADLDDIVFVITIKIGVGFAQAGFEVETIWVLPVGKDNSSQQMGKHGRDELRKCLYVWRARNRRSFWDSIENPRKKSLTESRMEKETG